MFTIVNFKIKYLRRIVHFTDSILKYEADNCQDFYGLKNEYQKLKIEN